MYVGNNRQLEVYMVEGDDEGSRRYLLGVVRVYKKK